MQIWHILPTWQIDFSNKEKPVKSPYQMAGTTAIIPIVGPTSKYGGGGMASTAYAREQIRDVATNPAVEKVLLYFDTPGGSVAGNLDLANDVKSLSSVKPTFAYASDLLASAGYEVASQAGKILASESTLVGSIGTMSAIEDTSGLAAKMGVVVHPITSGGQKGAGMPGTPVTPDMIEDKQRLINQVNDQFVSAVAKGRNMTLDRARQLADGRMHLAADAVQLGLIDGVATLETTIGDLDSFSTSQRMFSMYSQNGNGNPAALATPVQQPAVQAIPQTPVNPEVATPQTLGVTQTAPTPPPALQAAPAPAAPVAATIEQLEAACPGADADFILAQLRSGATVQSAQVEFIKAQGAQIAQLQTPAPAPAPQLVPVAPAPVQAAPAPQPLTLPGNQAILPDPEETTVYAGGPVAFWRQSIAQEERMLIEAGYNAHEARKQALYNVDAKNPGLREAYLAATPQVNPRAPKAPQA